jgi:hypothetical protein
MQAAPVQDAPSFSQNLPQEGIDRRPEEDYNTGGDSSSGSEDAPSFQPAKDPEAALFVKPVFTASFGDDSDDLGALPDLGSMANAFSSSGGGADMGAPMDFSGSAMGGADDIEEVASVGEDAQAGSAFDEFGSSAPMAEPSGGAESASSGSNNKASPLEGEFSGEQLAMGIRTILAKDNN